MKKTREIRIRISAVLLMVTLIIGGFAVARPESVWAEGSTHFIAVASDRHNTPEAIPLAMSGMPKSVEYVCLNGDMTDFSSSESPGGSSRSQMSYRTSTVLSEVKSVFPKLDNTNVSIIYGSHDANATDDAGIMNCIAEGAVPTPSGGDTPDVSAGQSGLIYTGYDGSKPAYYIYGVSYQDMLDPESAEASAASFKDWADEHTDAPVIAIGHVPIHALRNDNRGASYWNDAFNYASTGSVDGSNVIRDVVYLHGHNHTSESTEYFISPGETLKVQGTSRNESSDSVIRYTYITAGYLRDNHTATLIGVSGGSLSFTKYKGCILSFDPQGGTVTDDQFIRQGGLASKPADPKRDGYVFEGWYKEAAGENAWDFSSDTVDEDTTIYAKWTKGSRPAVPVIKTEVKTSSKKTKLIWNKVKGAGDYRIAYRKAGAIKWSRKWSNGKTTYTVSGLKKKGLYEFRVAAAFESGNSFIYSKDSKTKYRYINKLSGVKAIGKPGKKSIKVSWKKDEKATGYQIVYATNKDMKNAVKIKVKGSAKAYTIKKLKKGKTYYVRVCPLVKKNGKTYYGALCGKKKVSL